MKSQWCFCILPRHWVKLMTCSRVTVIVIKHDRERCHSNRYKVLRLNKTINHKCWCVTSLHVRMVFARQHKEKWYDDQFWQWKINAMMLEISHIPNKGEIYYLKRIRISTKCLVFSPLIFVMTRPTPPPWMDNYESFSLPIALSWNETKHEPSQII